MKHTDASSGRAARMVDVIELSRRGATVAGRVAPAELPRLADHLAQDEGEITFSLRGQPTARGAAGGQLQISAHLHLRCDVCRHAVPWRLQHTARFEFVPDEATLNRMAVSPDEDVEPIVGANPFDVVQLVEDEVLLALPMVPRHPDCRAEGETADESGEAADLRRPFAALADLKSRKH